MFFGADSPPDSPYSVLLWPLVFVGLALTIWVMGYRFEMDDRKAPWKWAAFIPLAVGLLIGYTAFKLYMMPNFDLFADANGIGRKVTYALYAATGLPILALCAMIGLSIYGRMNRLERI